MTDATGTHINPMVATPIPIAQAHNVVWNATYFGATGGFWLTTDPQANKADIFLTSGGGHGTKLLSPGTYYISIKLIAMQPGSYSVKFDPTGDGSTVGEPHITTVNGVKYDFQAAGEFVALRDNHGFEIQTRQIPVPTGGPLFDSHTGLAVGVAVNSAVACRMAGRRVTLQFNHGVLTPSSTLVLRIDGTATAIPAGGLTLGANERISRMDGGAYRLDFANGTNLIVTPGWWQPGATWYLNLDVLNTPGFQGLMGIVSGRNWLPDLPDGSHSGVRPASPVARYNQLYRHFADAWRVSRSSSLFDYGPGMSVDSFAFKDWPARRAPFARPGQTPVHGLPAGKAKLACRIVRDPGLNRDCSSDVALMGDTSIAKTYALQEKLRMQVRGKVKRRPSVTEVKAD